MVLNYCIDYSSICLVIGKNIVSFYFLMVCYIISLLVVVYVIVVILIIVIYYYGYNKVIFIVCNM